MGQRTRWSGAERNAAYRFVAAMEVLNGRGSLNENLFSQRLAAHLGMPGTAGTDSHQTTDIGKAATYFERDIETERDLIEEIRAGRCWPVDLTRGVLTASPALHTVPDSLAVEWQATAERRAAFLAGHPA